MKWISFRDVLVFAVLFFLRHSDSIEAEKIYPKCEPEYRSSIQHFRLKSKGNVLSKQCMLVVYHGIVWTHQEKIYILTAEKGRGISLQKLITFLFLQYSCSGKKKKDLFIRETEIAVCLFPLFAHFQDILPLLPLIFSRFSMPVVLY